MYKQQFPIFNSIWPKIWLFYIRFYIQVFICISASAHLLRVGLCSKECSVIINNWITAHNYERYKYQSFSPSLSFKGKMWGLDTVSRNVPYRKQTTEPKLQILMSFSGEIGSYPNISYCIHVLWEVYRPFPVCPPCMIIIPLMKDVNDLPLNQHDLWNSHVVVTDKSFEGRLFEGHQSNSATHYRILLGSGHSICHLASQ